MRIKGEVNVGETEKTEKEEETETGDRRPTVIQVRGDSLVWSRTCLLHP